MKTMIVADYAATRGLLVRQIVLSVFVSGFVAIMIGNAFMLVPMMIIMISLSFMLTIVAYDEDNEWERYRLTLPLTRRQTVLGRYAYMVLLTLGSLVLAVLTHGFFYVAAPVLAMLPFDLGFVTGIMEGDVTTVALSAIASFFIVLVLSSIIYPFSFRFGMTRALRWVPSAVIVFFLAAGMSIQSVNPQLFAEFFKWFDDPNTSIIAFSVCGLICVVFTVASAALATKLYQQREF